MFDVDRLLAACARVVSKDGSIVELRPEKAPRIWRPAIQRLIEQVGQTTATGRNRVPKAEWEALASRLRAGAAALIKEAEHRTLVDQAPSTEELDAAPVIEPWAPGRRTYDGYCLGGQVPGDAKWGMRTSWTSGLESFDLSQGWARTRDRLYRLGQRLPGVEIEGLIKTRKINGFRECGDEELMLIFEAERADLRWRLGQLKAPET